jgi:C4-dicarboxylate-specific signal transduction histidine kinase
MGYDILTKVIEFTESDLAIDSRMAKVAGLLVKDFPFDSCVIYTWDDKEKLFKLNVAAGSRKGRVESYGQNQGLPGLARKTKEHLEAYKPGAEGILWQETEDRGLKGFKSACVYPLKDRQRWYGLLYLKSAKKVVLSPRKKKLLEVISRLLVSNYKCKHHSQSLKKAGTKIKDIHSRLTQAEKLMVLGELSATFAHEIRNPLVSLGGFAARLKKKLEPDSSFNVYVDYMVNEVRRLEQIINAILRYTEQKEVVFEGTDLNSILSESLAFFSEVFKKHDIEIVAGFARKPLRVMADRHQLKIAFDNLIANAIQSMEQGGKLTVSTSGKKSWAVVDLTDNGGGIEPRYINNIFEPFFTTKKYGTGLGLDITKRIITKHKGRIDVDNKAGQGVTFSVKLRRT